MYYVVHARRARSAVAAIRNPSPNREKAQSSASVFLRVRAVSTLVVYGVLCFLRFILDRVLDGESLSVIKSKMRTN